MAPGPRSFAPGSITRGVVGAVGLIVLYGLVIALASGSTSHLVDQAVHDWYLLVLVVVGFGTQVALLSELRRRSRRQLGATAAGGAGVGASTVGMVACCSHHIAELLPFLGITGAAAFLYDYKVAFVLLGVVVNALGITIAWRRLRHVPSHSATTSSTTVHRRGATIASLAVAAGVALSLLAAPMATASVERARDLPTRTLQAGKVQITVTPQRIDDRQAIFEVAFDTHSTDLDLDISKAMVLTVNGIRWPKGAYVGDGPGGHHRDGVLRFAAAGSATGRVNMAVDAFGESVSANWRLRKDAS